jgi:hypothetical protein
MLIKTHRIYWLALWLGACPFLFSANEFSMIEDYRWSHRLIFVFTDAKNQLELVEQLIAEKKAINERDIRWFCWSSEGLRTNETGIKDREALQQDLLRYREHKKAANEVVLVGKDGGVKLRAKELDLDEIFRLTDSMPMRQAEMRAASR